MVRLLKKRQSQHCKSPVNEEEAMFEGRQAHSLILDRDGGENGDERMFRSQGSKNASNLDGQQIGWALDRSMSKIVPKSRLSKDGGSSSGRQGPSDVELIKERFSKLLLGEDMSGGGKGVSSALALSNAITNLAASVFSEQNKLEPMPAERKARWRREIDWLLSVTDHIVEFVASQQVSKDGTSMEIMVTQQRKDLLMNIPALRKLDAMLLGYLDNFKDQNEFWYVKKNTDDAEKDGAPGNDKWWLPQVKVPPEGLSDVSRKWLQFQKESVNQVLKAAMAINAQVLMEMEIPESYIEGLPKNGRASLGDAIYRSITVDVFDPIQFLQSVDLSTEHKVVDLKNRIEASIVIWKRKMHNKDGKSWGSAVSLEKREQFEERAETILHLIKHRFPGISQSTLDISKIQFNRDVGQAVLESYSRVIETLAHAVMTKIEDVLDADAQAVGPTQDRKQTLDEPIKKLDPKEELEKLNNMEASSMTLSDFMGWHLDQDADAEKKETEKLENLGGLRSPTARH
ncbi:uncharacterized protein A4U43_C01F15410 [Asparagus officinalis]|uniref:PRONE domain-containing protein n=1 Tax=Asparagus officinalis TaxID=4686 RepID=A0A5P1FPJ7_ASPOF|nr:rop guanine nucleotide exchange factor 12-like isoform X2 [Asparagus officinalis]ONK80236.1 uncharacterized protein A4U43_C01F15410 [Asparagus officinalis]